MTARFLKTIRFDASDSFAFPLAAEPDEWAISGGFAFADLEPGEVTGKTRQAFANGFLGLTSYGHATFTSVATMTDAERDAITDRLARHFVDLDTRLLQRISIADRYGLIIHRLAINGNAEGRSGLVLPPVPTPDGPFLVVEDVVVLL